mmetsp:Transcript_19812/g.41905  ORF Transcript_19812/g.41905 Transcript_19812/m.41905 type:complete len:212 (-) Transcript_19812:113-748(-)
MEGSLFCSAISCMRRCFFTVMGKYVPPFTVGSFATMHTSLPCTRPMPVTSPPQGTESLPYRSSPAYMLSSRKGEPGSTSWLILSLTRSLPLLSALLTASSPPPLEMRSMSDWSPATSLSMAALFSWNSWVCGSTAHRSSALLKYARAAVTDMAAVGALNQPAPRASAAATPATTLLVLFGAWLRAKNLPAVPSSRFRADDDDMAGAHKSRH